MKKLIFILLFILSLGYCNAQKIIYQMKPDTTQYIINDTIYEDCNIRYLSFYVSDGRVLSDYNRCLKEATIYIHNTFKVPVRYNETRTKMYFKKKEFKVIDKGNYIMYVLIDNTNNNKLNYSYMYIFDKTYNGFTKIIGAEI